MDNDICIKLGKRIRVCREKLNLSQKELATKVRISVSTLGKIEKGKTNPPLFTIYKIAKVLKIRLTKLFQ